MISLLRRYWNELVSYEGGMSLVMMNGLVAVPLIMAAFFYPLQVLALVVVLAVVSLAGYEGYVIWRKRHPTHYLITRRRAALPRLAAVPAARLESIRRVAFR